MMKFVVVGALALTSVLNPAQASMSALQESLTVKSVEVSEETLTLAGGKFTSKMVKEIVSEEDADARKLDLANGLVVAGEVIRTARDLIALGEELYVFVAKGKPVLNTQYAPVSVIPNVNGRAAEMLEMEGWRSPVSRKVTTVYKNIYGATLASLEYTILFSYGGSLDGKGAYIANAQIVPSKVWVMYGVTLDASMRLSGITNQGTRANPVANAVLQVQYKVKTLFSAVENNDTYSINGLGGIKKL